MILYLIVLPSLADNRSAPDSKSTSLAIIAQATDQSRDNDTPTPYPSTLLIPRAPQTRQACEVIQAPLTERLV
jgi:hypothetical protein